MIRGLIIRIAIFEIGGVLLVSLFHIFNGPPELGAIAVIVYVAVAPSLPAYYCVKHADEIPIRSARR